MNALQRRRPWITLLVCIGALAPALGASDTFPAEAHLSAEQKLALLRRAERRRMTCGSNAVFLMLRLQGIPTSLETVEQLLPVNDAGHSMSSLQDTAATLGLPLDLRRIGLEDLETCPMPLISFSENYNIDTGLGHYLVVFGVRDGLVYYLDSTTGKRGQATLRGFAHNLSGYVLFPSPTVATSFASFGLAGAGFFLTFGLVTLLLRRRTRRVLASIACLLLLGSHCFALGGNPEAPKHWRSGSNGGIVSAYLFGRMTEDVDAGYATFAAAFPASSQVSLGEIARVLGDQGAAVEVHRLSPRELGESVPCVVHLDVPRSTVGEFVVVLHAAEGHVAYLDGMARFRECDLGGFLQRWTGLAVTPKSPTPILGWIILGIGFCVALLFACRVQRKRVPKPTTVATRAVTVAEASS